jgi:HAMP domain-containing protein
MTEPQLNVWERALGWRKRQMIKGQITNEVTQKIRNDALEEVAQEFDSMRIAFGDTADSFATYVRDMKT